MKMKKRRTAKVIACIAVCLAVVAAVILGFLWNTYLNKNTMLKKFQSQQGQEVYILGTMHQYHFNEWLGYSMADLLHVIAEVQPDAVVLEAREEMFQEYGAVDGPVEMSVVYAYCAGQNIPVEMVDWWVVENDTQMNSTTDLRDDHIYRNIADKLLLQEDDERVLVILGLGHLSAQSKRLASNGFQPVTISNVGQYFEGDEASFVYPAGAAEAWEKRAFFYAYTHPEIVAQNDALNDEVKAQWTPGNPDGFYREQMVYCEWFENNILFQE